MAARINAIDFSVFGGLNVADEPGALLERSHGFRGGRWSHLRGPLGLPVGVEAAGGHDFDWERERLVKRRGSTLSVDLGSGGVDVLVASETIVLFFEVRLPATGTFAQFAVGEKSLYTNATGSWARLNDSTSSAYTHSDATVSSAAYVVTDGNLFIGLDGGNRIQVYRQGADLEPELDNGNGYTDAGGTSQTVTGTWGTGYDRLAVLDGRLAINNGDSVVEFTATNEPYDLNGGGNFPASGRVEVLKTVVPQFGDELAAILYIGTGQGWEFTSDLASANTIEGSPPPANPHAAVATANWLMYLSARGELWAINGNRIINIGRRLRVGDGVTGPLDTLDTAQIDSAHGFWDERRNQAVWWYQSDSGSAIDAAVGVDMQLGEPRIDEPQDSYETHTRMLHRTGETYISVAQTRSEVLGANADGKIYTLNNGRDDFASTAVDCEWLSPILLVGAPINIKNWLVHYERSEPVGDFDLTLSYLTDRAEEAAATVQFNQGSEASVYGTATYGSGTYSSTGVVANSDDTDLVAEALQLKIANGQAGETFTITALEQRYTLLTEER